MALRFSRKALWFAALASLIVSVLAFMNSAYYAWLQATGAQDTWRTNAWSWVNLVISGAAILLFAWLLLRIHRSGAASSTSEQ